MSGPAVVVFAGPTLPAATIRARLPGAQVEPPAAQGDVYRWARARAAAIVLLDGRYDGVPAVWHKEILYALAEGTPVIGAASMGAVRAAELADFGMVGVGWIFRAFRSGLLCADDEVAVAHAGPEDDYRATSEALVNIRRTVERAQQRKVIDCEVATRLVEAAADLFYAERTYPAVCALARERGSALGGLQAFEAWLPHGRINQKHRDALAALRAVPQCLAAPLRPAFQFMRTDMWEQAVLDAIDGGGATLEDVIDELRLRGDWHRAHRAALLRALALAEADRRGLVPYDHLLAEAEAVWRRRHGLGDTADVAAWEAANDLPPGGSQCLVRDQARLALLYATAEPDLRAALADQLRAEGLWPELAGRARRKQELGLLASPDPAASWQWFAHTRLGQATDPAAWAEEAGFASVGELLSAVTRERRLAEGDE